MHRRKQLGALLRKAPEPLGRPDEALAALFATAGLDPQARAEQLDNAQWQSLACAFAAAGAR
jgi:16S rRNA A1518/A1519 N6-dimethyltransferase RsmA/KsgA/DIM1 with predicted DNA glycosylase/AP lyase activity